MQQEVIEVPAVKPKFRLGGLVRNFASFGTVGGLSFIIDSSLFNLLLFVGEKPLLAGHDKMAMFIAAAVATLFSWLANRSVTFKDRERGKPVAKELLSFIGINLIAIMVSMICVAVNRDVLHNTSALSANIANYGVGLPLGMAFRFVAYRWWLYTPAAQQEKVAS